MVLSLPVDLFHTFTHSLALQSDCPGAIEVAMKNMRPH